MALIHVATDDKGNVAPVGVGGVNRGLPMAGGDGLTPASASNPSIVKPAPYTFLGYQQITAATLAASTPLTVPTGATTAIIQNNTTQILRFRPDGATTAPTTAVGQRIAVNAPLTLDIGNAGLTATRLIIEAAGTGTADVTYYS